MEGPDGAIYLGNDAGQILRLRPHRQARRSSDRPAARDVLEMLGVNAAASHDIAEKERVDMSAPRVVDAGRLRGLPPSYKPHPR